LHTVEICQEDQKGETGIAIQTMARIATLVSGISLRRIMTATGIATITRTATRIAIATRTATVITIIMTIIIGTAYTRMAFQE
jgi:hypothetical protein